ncbi:MAG: PEP-CTERM sorting domain-containing protein [Phycisphaerales bacterium]|nr:PEP-CTERM sorting domain-containing protein [Phycisphaerales bacterium]MCB9855244.1 PEP-CTERM sorting domain-containing protein [Phycisphaerales bacterium]MCB9862837.1 PEP-CTERM sorting domain-containing protein [Phycisphaerales bacterium]
MTARRWMLILPGLITALAAAPTYAEHGRFLQDAAPTNIVQQYGNANPTAFDQVVTDTVKDLNVGNIRFDYDTYTLRPGNVGGGGALSGGFFMNPGFQLKPGFSLAWVQTVNATHAGDNEWNLPDTGAGTFPDADPMDRAPGTFGPDDTLLAPTYVFNTPAANTTGTAPTLGFQDFPGRGFADGNQTWLAELGLTCISNTATLNIDGRMFRDVRVIDTLLWGFDLNGLPVAMPGIGNVGANAPHFWSDPTGTYLDTLNNFYDGMGGGGGDDGMGGMLPAKVSALYHFSNNSNCFQAVPEPGTLLLLLPGLFVLVRRHRD